jgi:chemotaxis protein CheX
MDVRYLNSFLSAFQEIFDTMINLPITLGKPTIKKSAAPLYAISGIIGMSGSVTGCVVINLSEETALQLASNLLDEKITSINSDCTDAIGEITNMLAGNAKSNFPVAGIAISVPTVISGKHEINYPSGVPIISIPCRAGNGNLIINVAIKDE